MCLFTYARALIQRGSGSTIPPNAVLDFEVEMLDWEENDNRSNVTDDGRVKILVEKEGKGWKSPTEGATAIVKLTGYIGRYTHHAYIFTSTCTKT